MGTYCSPYPYGQGPQKMSILGQMYRNIAVHCFEGETLKPKIDDIVAAHL